MDKYKEEARLLRRVVNIIALGPAVVMGLASFVSPFLAYPWRDYEVYPMWHDLFAGAIAASLTFSVSYFGLRWGLNWLITLAFTTEYCPGEEQRMDSA